MEIFKPTVVLLWIMALGATAHCRVQHKRTPEFRAFPPSRQSLLDQNAEIDRLHLPRIKTTAELHELVQSGDLVPIHPSAQLALSSLLPTNRAYARPWVAAFLDKLSQDF